MTDKELAALVTDKDIDAALAWLREINGGHEPYAPAVFGVAKRFAKERLASVATTVKAPDGV